MFYLLLFLTDTHTRRLGGSFLVETQEAHCLLFDWFTLIASMMLRSGLTPRNFAEMLVPLEFREQAAPGLQNLKSARRNEKKTRS